MCFKKKNKILKTATMFLKNWKYAIRKLNAKNDH